MKLVQAVSALLILSISPAALAAEGGFEFKVHGYFIIDALVFFGILFYYARGPAKRFLESRHDAVAKEMNEAMALKASAEDRLARYGGALTDLEGELKALAAEFDKDAESDRTRIATQAAAEAKRIVEDTAHDIEREHAQLRLDLERELAERVVTKAQTLVKARMNASVQKDLVQGFITDLEARGDLRA